MSLSCLPPPQNRQLHWLAIEYDTPGGSTPLCSPWLVPAGPLHYPRVAPILKKAEGKGKKVCFNIFK